ncbi:hypothetical protein AP75_05010 [Kaistella haifensis DSM 19056]|uniref:Uncharacterized protein n=1 Tax=Kaistella haifensis DSM 19056 TaxID=1450526 RepID=A0A246BAD3_9FLAO|nr:hypothetical protein [Kaistella haifensis]OWK98648.1 hypothetical protein AP75_05010 [Kaistella haifensis DSM 19056]HRM35379.1 hypothetical protein [Aliarcobacter cryaerophilus]
MKNLQDLQNKGTKLSKSKMRKIGGGLFGIFCITGILDGIPGNTHFSWGSCPKSVQPMGQN